MSKGNDSIQKTIFVALAVSLVCAVFVSAAAVMLKPIQEVNKKLTIKENVLRAAGLIQGEAKPSKQKIEELFSQVTPAIVELETGRYVDPKTLGLDSADQFDERRAAKDPKLSEMLPGDQDIAKLKRQEKYAKVYLVKKDGKLDKVVLPIRGYGLWSTLWGFIAFESDGNTVAGLTFYEHAETPGLGGEVDNPRWKAQWPGKKVYDEKGQVRAKLVKGGVVKGSPDEPYAVDALAGATLTSRGVSNLVQYWLGEYGFKKYLERVAKGEANNV